MMNLHERAEMVRAMETIVRSINFEDIIESWLMCGVADCDIDGKETDEDLECYCEDAEFKDLMTLFLRLIDRASRNGGIYCDGIVSAEKHIEWK